MIDIQHMSTFVAVVEERGFTAAANRLGIAKSVCSRRVTELEENLQVQLVQRTTRSVVPTDAGLKYYEECQDILARIDAAAASIQAETGEVRGRLRVSVPLSYCEFVLAPKLEAFSAQHPDVELVLNLSDRRVDLISEGYDVAVRIGDQVDSNLFTRKIGAIHSVCCASPDYLARHGTPETPDDLTAHECLQYTLLNTGSEWVFQNGPETIRKRISGRIATNNGTYIGRLAQNGFGIALLPDFIVQTALEDGRLIQILPNYDFGVGNVQVVFPQKRNMPATVRAFIDHLSG